MNYNIASCDDSEADRMYISALVSKWAVDTGHIIQTHLFSSAENFMFHYTDNSRSIRDLVGTCVETDTARSFIMLRMEDFMIGSRVFIVKERDEWSNFAEFVGAMAAKYAEKMDFESLPDTDLYLLKRDMLDWYKAYNRAHHKKVYFDVEYVW